MGSEAMSPHVMKKLAKPMLFAAAIIWGTSFFVMKNALDVIPVFYLLAIRFTAGAVLLAAVCWKKWAGFTRDYLWRGAVIGAFLFLAYSVQTFGLDRTTPSKKCIFDGGVLRDRPLSLLQPPGGARTGTTSWPPCSVSPEWDWSLWTGTCLSTQGTCSP